MPTITLTAVVDENGHLEFDVPLPPGPVEVVVRPVKQQEMSREEVRAKLKAAGLLEDYEPSPDAMEVSDEERDRLAKVFSGDPPMSELIDEDREDRW